MMKRQRIESQHIRRAAQGELCTVQIMGICRHDPATTVLAHLPDESGGMGRKSDDISGVFACDLCHDCIDGRRPWPDSEATREWSMRRAQVRTWRRLVELGVVVIKGVRV
jgi:hypothetical protein